MLLPDFTVAFSNWKWKKKHKKTRRLDQYNIDREYLSVNNNSQKELDQNQESSPLLRWSLINIGKYIGKYWA